LRFRVPSSGAFYGGILALNLKGTIIALGVKNFSGRSIKI